MLNMNHYHPLTRHVVALAVLASAWGTASRARDQSPPARGFPPKIELATRDVEPRRIEHLTRSEVRSSDNLRVGTIADFVIEPNSGRIFFAAVSGDAATEGDALRLVPFNALTYSRENDNFTSSVRQSEWSKLPRIGRQDFRRGLLNVQPRNPQLEPDPMRANFGGRLVRAAELPGRPIEIEGREVGGIEDLVVDFTTATVSALVELDEDPAGRGQSYIVPLTHLQAGNEGRDPIRSTLTRSDFQAAAAGAVERRRE